MAINKIQNDELHDFVDPSLGFKTDQRIRNMICGVAELAFQCLQSVRDTRPSMMEALEILRNIENRSCGTGKAPLVPESPDSVTVLWISKTSTPNASVVSSVLYDEKCSVLHDEKCSVLHDEKCSVLHDEHSSVLYDESYKFCCD
ncbi:LEAF RUST 10 DISEASE-RESISTANCE LOCUS RECEPTOR-LIKE PROTEIN KINASE-like 1.2, partial [Cucurbita argyrosperma subsp. argyrosperma]